MNQDHAQGNTGSPEEETLQTSQKEGVEEENLGVSPVEEALATASVYSAVRGAKEEADRVENERESTKRKKEAFIQIFERTMGTITVACEKAEISRWTYYEWMKTDPTFRQKIQEIERQRLDMTEDRLFKAIQGDNIRAITFFLEKRHENYKPKSQVEVVTGDRTFEDILYEQAQKRKDALEKEQHDSTQ